MLVDLSNNPYLFIYRWMKPTRKWPVAVTVRWPSWRQRPRRKGHRASSPTTSPSSSTRSPIEPSGIRCERRVHPCAQRTDVRPRYRPSPPYQVARRYLADRDSWCSWYRCRTTLCIIRTLSISIGGSALPHFPVFISAQSSENDSSFSHSLWCSLRFHVAHVSLAFFYENGRNCETSCNRLTIGTLRSKRHRPLIAEERVEWLLYRWYDRIILLRYPTSFFPLVRSMDVELSKPGTFSWWRIRCIFRRCFPLPRSSQVLELDPKCDLDWSRSRQSQSY